MKWFTNVLKTILLSLLFIFLFGSGELYAQSCALNVQQAYKSYSSPAVFYITKDCTKRPFKNPDVFFSYFNSWAEVQPVSGQLLNSIPSDNLGFMPWGPKKHFKSGTLVKTVDDPKVYVLLGSEKCWLKNETVFNELNYSFDWVVDVDPRFLDKYSTCPSPISYTDHHPPGTLIKYSDSPDVYVLKEKDGVIKKKLIKNEQEFNQLGYRWDRIITIEKTETYPDIQTQPTQKKKVGQGDGSYKLKEGEMVVADNGVGVGIKNIRELNAQQRSRFGEDQFWMTVDFYVDEEKITLTPVRFSGTYRASNFNKLYALNVGYKRQRNFEESGEEYVNITINSIEDVQINQCQDLVELCKQKGFDSNFCERKYCPTDSTENEKKFNKGRFTTILPEDITDIKDEVLNQMELCYDEVSNYLKVDPMAEEVVVRFYYDNGSAKTTDYGITWPISRDNLKSDLDEWRQATSDKCDNSLLTHELIHYFARGISMDDIFHEGITNYITQNLTPTPSSNISCLSNGWQGNTSESHASQIQVGCYTSCLPACYSSTKQVEIEEGQTLNIGDKEVEINKLDPRKYWPGTNKTGSYHGEVQFSVKDDSGNQIDQTKIFIGDLYDKNDIRFLPDGIAIQKTIYPDRVEKTRFLRAKIYSNVKTDSPSYCSDNCKNICQKRINENTIVYNDLDQYLKQPWFPTYKMFYNTGQCVFKKVEQDNPGGVVDILRAGKKQETQAGEFCVGKEIEQRVAPSTFTELQQTFDINSECSWSIPRIGNIDCWNKSCRSGKIIR